MNLLMHNDIVRQAAARTGYREQLVTTPLAVISRRYAHETPSEIAQHLQAALGPDNKAASRDFVEWAIAQLKKTR